MYAKRHGGRIQPEARLIILWFMTPLNILGLNLIGSTLTQHWSYYVLAVGWGIHNVRNPQHMSFPFLLQRVRLGHWQSLVLLSITYA